MSNQEFVRLCADAAKAGWRDMLTAPRDKAFSFDNPVFGPITMGTPIAVLCIHPSDPEEFLLREVYWTTGPTPEATGYWWNPDAEEPLDLDVLGWMPLPVRDQSRACDPRFSAASLTSPGE